MRCHPNCCLYARSKHMLLKGWFTRWNTRKHSVFACCQLCSSLSNITCQILPSFHALTGCDTTPAFFRIRKKYAYKILKTSHEELFDLVSLTNADLETTMNTAKHALSLLCDPKGKFKSCHHDLYIAYFCRILKKAGVVSHPVRAWKEGKIWHVILESELHKSWTGIYLLPSLPPDTIPMCCSWHFEKANQRHYHFGWRISCPWIGLNIKFWC
jgi:hypothetical protein